jgi:hypothetical protein
LPKSILALKIIKQLLVAKSRNIFRKIHRAFNKTAESLAAASSKQEDILEELTEQLSKLNGRRN